MLNIEWDTTMQLNNVKLCTDECKEQGLILLC